MELQCRIGREESVLIKVYFFVVFLSVAALHGFLRESEFHRVSALCLRTCSLEEKLKRGEATF